MKKYLTIKATIEIDDEENNINTFDDCLNDYDNIDRPLDHLKDTGWLIDFVSLNCGDDENSEPKNNNYGTNIVNIDNIKTIRLCSDVRYWEDSIIDGKDDDENIPKMPCSNSVYGYWSIDIDVKTGIIKNWEKGHTAKIHYKTCDENVVTLYDKDYNSLGVYEGYVPNCFSIDENGYGDYILMTIDENGKIQNWKFNQEKLNDIINNMM